MGSSPASMPTGNPGGHAAALAKVRSAVDMLEDALRELPVGMDDHKAVSESITKLAKIVPASEQQPGIQMSALRQLMQNAGKSAPLQALLRAAKGRAGGAPGGAAGGPPGAGGPPPGLAAMLGGGAGGPPPGAEGPE